ncbi:MAG: hypothetical protein JRE23_10225 [Deltaproteobacteria bacterium]|nr:hypothetical protein [Deltaproteobacteria bacterium]
MNLKEKKEYRKPEIRKVRLAPEEAVLAACKAAGTARRQGNKCDNLQGACINRAQGS